MRKKFPVSPAYFVPTARSRLLASQCILATVYPRGVRTTFTAGGSRLSEAALGFVGSQCQSQRCHNYPSYNDICLHRERLRRWIWKAIVLLARPVRLRGVPAASNATEGAPSVFAALGCRCIRSGEI